MNEIIPGSVISGTSDPQRLIGKFMELLQEHNPDLWVKWTTPGTSEYIPMVNLKDPWWKGGAVDGAIADLIDALDELAPPGHYFGGEFFNDNDFGFWRCDRKI